MVYIKRPAHLSIVERLGGFWQRKCSLYYLFLKEISQKVTQRETTPMRRF